MSIHVEPTPEHRALAAVVNARMAADSRIVNAKAALLRLAGVGALVALAGVGAATAMFGYSFIKDERSSVDKIADALARALDRSTLKTAGEVRIAEGSTVQLSANALKLDPDASVQFSQPLKLDPDTTVKLDPNARLRVSAGGETPRPTTDQMRPGQTTQSGGKAVTNYTIFKSVPFGRGKVTTGWSFASSEEASPSSQYCYYAEGGGADPTVEVTTYIASNGFMLPNVRARNFEVASAASSCIWFDGGSTRPQRSEPRG